MSSASLNLTSLATNATVPVSGHSYQLENLRFSHWLDNARSNVRDGNPIAGYLRNITIAPNQVWKYLTYPSSDGDTVFTLQVLSTLQSNLSSSVIDDRGGYMRVDSSNNSLVQGGQPQAWKLIEVSPSVYKMSPFEDSLSGNGTLVATDTHPGVVPHSNATNQLRLVADNSSIQQMWSFYDIDN